MLKDPIVRLMVYLLLKSKQLTRGKNSVTQESDGVGEKLYTFLNITLMNS
jgi:hypothetical protein